MCCRFRWVGDCLVYFASNFHRKPQKSCEALQAPPSGKQQNLLKSNDNCFVSMGHKSIRDWIEVRADSYIPIRTLTNPRDPLGVE